MDHLSLRDCFAESFSRHGKGNAVTLIRNGEVETELTYEQLDTDSNRLANTFLNMGVKKGDRVIQYQPKSLFSTVAHIALLKLGAVAVPLNPGFKKSEMEYYIHDTGAGLILSGPEQVEIIDYIAPGIANVIIDPEIKYQDIDFFRSAGNNLPDVEINRDDPGVIIYTSGTTGLPKGAVLTHENLLNDAGNIIKIWEISESDVLGHALPLFHVHGLCFALHTFLVAGGHVIMLDKFTPECVIDILTEKKGEHICNVFMAVPAMYSRLMGYLGDRKLDFSHMRLFTSGSAPLLSKDFYRIKEVFGKEPVEREGMSETGMNFSNPLKGVRKPGSIGVPLPGLEARIVDPDTLEDMKQGDTGEFWLKSRSITPGYWQKAKDTEKAFHEGWFRTGDLGYIDDEGYFFLTDRLKHIIISGGENISPKEIESVINQLEFVAETAVVGIPDDNWGEKVVAAVVARTGAGFTIDDIQSHCREKLHDWKCPKEVKVIEAMPKNTMGKVLKDEVKKYFQ